LVSSAFYNEDTSLPFGGIYYDVVQCISTGIGGICSNAADGHLFAADEDAYSVQVNLLNVLFPTTGTTGMATLASTMTGATTNYEVALEAVANTAGLTAALTTNGLGTISTAMSLTNAQVDTAFQRLVSQEPARGNRAGLLNIFRAPDAEAKDDGQYGVNFSGYLDDVGSGVEWGVYFNNTHANQPRIRMLGITNGYATDFFGILNALQTGAAAAVGQTFDITDGAINANEQLIYGAAFGQAICGLLAPGVAGPFANATHFFDPSLCYAATPGATRTAFIGNATGAIATLSFANAGRYQLYYPEDIQTFGVSLSTNLGGTAANFEVAYRPDFPLQIDIADLTNNLIDSTGGTFMQSVSSWAAAGSPADARALLLGTTKWSATPNCDLSSATGNASGEMAGYNECDGTAEMDVWTFDANFATSYTASHPFVTGAGADSGFSLFEIGAVSVPDMDYAQGVVRSGQFQSGYDVNQNGCMDPSGLTNTLVPQANGLFGLGYCEDNAGADSLSMTYRIRTGVTYNNFQNSAWTFSPSFGFDHDFYGDGPSSMGGFVDGRMKASLTAGFTRSDLAVSLGYQMNMGDPRINGSTDKDIATASFSYAY